jgi:DNA-binding NarL/FixJ family response regulator
MIADLSCAEVVGCAGEASEAAEQIAELQPDVVVLDLALRCGSGFQVLSEMRSLGVRPVTIVLTNYSYEPFRKAAYELGAAHFFDKSIEFGEVPKVIDCLAPQESRAPT